MASTAIPLGGAKPAAALAQPESHSAVIWRRFRKHRLAVVSGAIVLVIFIASLLAPLIAPFDVNHLDPSFKYAGFGARYSDGSVHILGTDHLGRDVFTRLLYGARITLTVALSVAILVTIIGTALGALAGYFRGWVDYALMRVLDFAAGIPDFPLLLILSSLLLRDPDAIPIPGFLVDFFETVMLVREREAKGVIVIIGVLTLLGWTGIARLARGEVLRIREAEFVSASRSLGMSDAGIILKHVLPNSLAPLIVAFTQVLASAFLTETVLSFLGFGVSEPTPTWGNMMANAQTYILENKAMPIMIGIPMLLCSLAFNFVGDGLRDALDPRLKL